MISTPKNTVTEVAAVKRHAWEGSKMLHKAWGRLRDAVVAGAVVATTAIVVAWPGTARAAPPPAEHYARLPTLSDVVVSPSGKRMAFTLVQQDGWRRLGVLDLDPIGGARMVGGFSNADVQDVAWVSDDRLVYGAYPRKAEATRDGAGVFAVNHDGSEPLRLISWREENSGTTGTSIRARTLPYGWFFHSAIDDGSNEILVEKVVEDGLGDVKEVQLARLNASTGRLRNLAYGMPERTFHWVLDAQHEPRVVVARTGPRQQVYWRKPGGDSWEQVADFDPLGPSAFWPWRLDADGRLLVVASFDGDTEALYAFDLAAKRLNDQPLVKVKGFDLQPESQVDSKTGRLLGVHFTADRPLSYWFDDQLGKAQRGIDQALPEGRSNRLYCGRCESTRFFVVRSSSDRHPGEYLLFDRSKGTLQDIGAAMPWLQEASQGRRSLHYVAARDGLQMPVYVTHPPQPASGPQAAVVLVHGGPWVRGSDLGWHAEAQFLASRGYVVLEPEFRGSDGYGTRHQKAGWREWGRAMQDDLVDAVQWAAKEELVDPAKVCIAGASYGGYAALMAPIASPGVFRCAASFAGVTDIELMYSIHWSDVSPAAKRYSMPVLIGDPEKDRDRLRAASPLKRVAEIKIPVLLVHGGADSRVPIKHAHEFAAAARSAGVPLEMHVYPEAGHGFFDAADEADYLQRLEQFLEKSLRAPR